MTRPATIERIGEAVWEIPTTAREGMRVPARIFASSQLFEAMDDGVFDQTMNVAMLPGIVRHAYCMPDGHWGYGFPIGGVAAFDPEEGIISPGGIGFDINCGMRLLRTNLTLDDIQPHVKQLIDRIARNVPAGVGGAGGLKLSHGEFGMVAEQGSSWIVDKGLGLPDDLERTEDGGCFDGADAGVVSERALERGFRQMGTLGAGNHYLEIQVVKPENVRNEKIAHAFGLDIPYQIVVMIHCGSRGFGHQIATDFLQSFTKAMGSKYHLSVPDRNLTCAPFRSLHGQEYFSAMKCAANMAFANRQVIAHRIRSVFAEVFGRSAADLGMDQVYDIAHNTAKLERHMVNGKWRELLVHRKGATRAFGPGYESIPVPYREVGQPVILGGSMETGSYLLAGTNTGEVSFFSTAHGSGRVMSRKKARAEFMKSSLRDDMLKRGIYVKGASRVGLAEEAGGAYKSIDEVVEASEAAGLCTPVARLVPIGNVKG